MRRLFTRLLVLLLLVACGCARERPAAAPIGAGGSGPHRTRGAVATASEPPGEARDEDGSVEKAAEVPRPEPAPAKLMGAPPPDAAKTPAPPPPQPAAGPYVTQGPRSQDFIIYTAILTMAVYQVEPGLDAVERVARELGGYLALRGDNEVTVRVPRARFDEALRRVQQVGDVLHRDIRAEDVTDQYVELETRLRNARVMRDRLEQLLARASVKEAVEIEKELGRVTGEIESMEGKLKLLRDKIAYSTITVRFEPRGASAVRDLPLRLPFGWLTGLGLGRLLNLGEGER